jgi:hypothetical protein
MLAENWDAPIVIASNVQLLESLFSNRPSACRKLHNLMDAVILFDEAQSLPAQLAVPTLAALSHLSAAYRTSVVFAIATQPAFDSLYETISKHSTSSWRPIEAVPDHPALFAALQQVDATNERLCTIPPLAALPRHLCDILYHRHRCRIPESRRSSARHPRSSSAVIAKCNKSRFADRRA